MMPQCLTEIVFPLVGLVLVLRFIVGFIKFVHAYFIRPQTNLFKEYGAPNSWAIVTGASDGIGFAYSKALAAAGFNVIMVARNISKLQEKRSEILAKHPSVEIKLIQLDFNTDYTPSLYKEIESEIKGKDIAILVNNVGIGNAHAFETYPYGKIREILRVTLSSFIHMTRIVLPALLDRSRRAAVLTISSATGMRPWPYFTIYGSSKSFMNIFTASLAEEYKGRNVDFMNCITGEVISGTHTKGSVVSITSDQCAIGQLKFLGYQTLTFGHLIHYLSSFVDFEILRSAIAKAMSQTYDRMWKEEEVRLTKG